MAVFEHIKHQNVEGIRSGRKNRITHSFVVYRIGDTLIDTAPSNQWTYLKSFFQEKAIRQILLTHHHEDHSGNARNLAELTGITPQASELTRSIMAEGFSIPLLQKFVWGASPAIQLDALPEKITLDDDSVLEAIATPGHAEDMLCYHSKEHGWLFTADLFIAKNIRYMRYDENLAILINSISDALTLDFDTIFCPHRGVLPDGKSALQQKHDNLMTLCVNAQNLQKQGRTSKEIMLELLGKEDSTSYLSAFSFCKHNLISEALKVRL